MNFILDHPWLVGISLAIVGSFLIILGGRWLAKFSSWIQIRIAMKTGRVINWTEALKRCKAGPAVVVLDSKSRPPKVWFVTGHDESAFFSRKEARHSKRLLIIDPPERSRICEEVEKAGGRVAEVDINGTFW